MFDLRGKVAIVTGGNRGIGFGMSRGLADAGARVVVAARDREKSAAAVEELGSGAFAVETDVGDETSVAQLVRRTLDECGRLDILINNAGMQIRKAPQDLSLAEWNQVMTTNLTSAFLTSRAVYPAMKAAGGGKIINVGSMVSFLGMPFAPVYGASKGGIVQFTRACATAWARENIQVNAVLPGWTDTDLTRKAREQVEGLNDSVLRRTPAGRWGTPDDFSGVAVFLASSASDFINGAAIPVDGGYLIQG